MPVMTNTITDVSGLKVGHAEDLNAITGCTVILCEKGAVCGVDQRGGAPGTRETDAVKPMHLVGKVHGILLGGGSAYGLDAASGVMRYLEDHGAGFNVGVARVPVVPGAILFDLAIGDPKIRPDANMGYTACQKAHNGCVEQGCVGAGTGATVGKLLGMGSAMKSGLGTASISLGGGLVVGALVVVNALGDVIDPDTGKIIAGLRPVQQGPIHIGGGGQFANTLEVMKTLAGRAALSLASHQNTVIGVVATNARMSREEANKMAQMAHDGLARAVRPAHLMLDGDTIFALATGSRLKTDISILGAYGAEVFAKAIVNAVRSAVTMGGLPSARDIQNG